jgi:hypothetical protein
MNDQLAFEVPRRNVKEFATIVSELFPCLCFGALVSRHDAFRRIRML